MDAITMKIENMLNTASTSMSAEEFQAFYQEMMGLKALIYKATTPKQIIINWGKLFWGAERAAQLIKANPDCYSQAKINFVKEIRASLVKMTGPENYILGLREAAYLADSILLWLRISEKPVIFKGEFDSHLPAISPEMSRSEFFNTLKEFIALNNKDFEVVTKIGG